MQESDRYSLIDSLSFSINRWINLESNFLLYGMYMHAFNLPVLVILRPYASKVLKELYIERHSHTSHNFASNDTKRNVGIL